MLSPNRRLSEVVKFVTGLAPIAPSSSVPDYVSLKGYEGCTILVLVDNGATVTGSDITVKQAQAVANTGEKALAFDRMLANVDTGAADTLVETAVASNTFTTNNTDNKNLLYVLDVRADQLDINNGFDCIRLGTGNSTNAVLGVIYALWPAKYAKSPSPTPSAILD